MNPNLLSFISACTALIATIIGPYVAFRTTRSQIQANVISTNRAKWIDTMRDLIAEAVSDWTGVMYLRAKMIAHDATAIATNPEMLKRVEQGLLTNSKIRLMLNPNEPDSQHLLKSLEAALNCLRSTDDHTTVEHQVRGHVDEIMHVGQSIHKREWLRVKQGT